MMRQYATTFICISALIQSSWARTESEEIEARRNEAEQVELWEKNLATTQGKPDEAKMSELGLGLRNMGYRSTHPVHDSSSEVGSLYRRLQTEILAIPGHADFYAEPILESYRAYRDPTHPKHSGSMTWFSSSSRYGFATLKHLPSPETVRILGDMLWEEWERKLEPESTVHIPSALAHQAVWTLLDLPLRNKPTEHFERYETEDYLPAWQDWYEKVKAGEIPFSFVGQAVEYRFQPDGTVTETPIEIPEEERIEATTNAPREPAGTPSQAAVGEQDSIPHEELPTWIWIAIAALLSGALVLWLRVGRRTG